MARRRALTDNEIRQYLEDHYLSPTESGDEDGNSATENSDSEEEYMPPNNAESDSGESSNPDDPSVDLDKECKCFMLNIFSYNKLTYNPIQDQRYCDSVPRTIVLFIQSHVSSFVKIVE